MPSYFKWIGCLFLLLNFLDGYSQPSITLKKFKEESQSDFNSRFNRAASFAKEHSIPLVQNTTEGRQLLLVDVINNIPIYLSGLNTEAAITTGVSKLRDGMSGINLEGEGMLIGVWDEGSVKDHIEFGNRVISKEVNNDQTHPTHVTGTLIASGINPDAKGMAPKAEATTWYFNNDLAEMAALAKPDYSSLLISNHSYGTVTGWTKVNGVWNWSGDPSVSGDEDYRFGFYGNKAAALDELANLAPYYTIVWAAGNDRGEPGNGSRPPDCNGGTGYDCIIPESVAKNIITVGAINAISNYSGSSSVVMSNFSSWGPTDDGRIKPDLVGAGVNIFSTTATGTDTYGFSSGTSMATPNVAGSLLLLQELYGKLHGGARMKSSTLKALAIHTAKEAGVLPGPDYSFGWGVLDVDAAAKLMLSEDGVSTIIRNETLVNGSQFEFAISPVANQKITATLAWNDPAATPVSIALDPTNLMLVNDLDLRLVKDDGSLQYPWLLDPSTPSGQAIKGDNYRDNVEKIEFSFPQAKPYRIVVSHKGQLTSGKQNFSLVLTYKSTQATGNNLYWVGDSGNWNDNTHWSLTSGGTPAFVVPTAADQIIVDENSFDGVGLDQITLTQNRTCNSFKWIRTVSAKLNLQGNTLTVGKEFTVADDSFATSGSGTITCTSTSTGNLFFDTANLGAVAVKVDGGNWKMSGDLSTASLELVSGQLEIDNSSIRTDALIANSGLDKKLTLAETEIEISQSQMDGANLELVSSNATIRFNNTTGNLNWNNLLFEGLLDIAQSNVIINGNNTIHEIKLEGAVDFTGSNIIEELVVLPGSTVSLVDASQLSVELITEINGTVANPIEINSVGKASFHTTGHFLRCVDYVIVSNVDFSGTGRINLGPNSTITNSLNWLNQSCESVVYADFETNFLCAGGFTEFISKSTGENISWEWDFGDSQSSVNTSVLENPYHEYVEAGKYIVQLTVSDGQQSHSYMREIEVVTSSIPENQVAVTSSELVSMELASGYQWFFNEQKINGATGRSYGYGGSEGLYRVVTYAGECNRSSNLVTITGVEDEVWGVRIYPNPASSELFVENSEGDLMNLSLTDLMGRQVWKEELVKRTTIPVSQFSAGIYLLKMQRGKQGIIKKIVVQP